MKNETQNSPCKKRYLAYLIPAILVSACNGGRQSYNQPLKPVLPTGVPSDTPTIAPTPCTTCTMFYAGNNGHGYNGDLLHQAESLGATNITTGIQGADYICQKEAKNPSWHPNIPSGESHIYKAMISDGSNRIACETGNCSIGTSRQTDWVLYPNTSYLSESGAEIGQTNESAIFGFGTLVPFDYGSIATTQTTWNGHEGTIYSVYKHNTMTGLNTNWTSSNLNCQKWTTPSATEFYERGCLSLLSYDSHSNKVSTNQLNLLNSNQIQSEASDSAAKCDIAHIILNSKHRLQANTQGLICVEQN